MLHLIYPEYGTGKVRHRICKRNKPTAAKPRSFKNNPSNRKPLEERKRCPSPTYRSPLGLWRNAGP